MSKNQFKEDKLLSNSKNISEFNVIEYAINKESDRFRFYDNSYAQSLVEHDCFRSVYNHSQEVREFYKKNNRISGFKGKVYSKRLLLVTNKNNSIETSLKDVQTFIQHLEAKYDISRSSIYYLFDGVNRFYLSFHENLFGGFQSSEDLPHLHNVIKSKLCEGIFSKAFDYDIYNHTSLMPLVNTYRIKEKRFAVELTDKEIFSDAESIKKIALERRGEISRIEPDELSDTFSSIKEEATKILTDSKMFLKIIFGEVPNGMIELRFLGGDNRSPVFNNDLAKTISTAQSFNGQSHVFFGLATRKDKDSGTKVNCQELNVLFADVDYGTEGHKKPSPYETKEQVLKAIAGFKFKPNIILHSGHGFQFIWKLSNPIALNADTIKRAELLMRKINYFVKGDPTQNVDRIFRMPFTLNIKTTTPIQTTIVEMNPDISYSLEEIEAEVGSTPVSITSTEKNEDIPIDPEGFEKIKKSCIWIQNLYKKAEETNHLEHKAERYPVACIAMKFPKGKELVHDLMSKCSDYDKEKTEHQLTQIKGQDYTPPLCSTLCETPCDAIKAIGKKSPIAFAYRGKKTDSQEEIVIMPINIFEKDGVYIKKCGKPELGIYSPVTSFHILPKELLVLKDGDCLTCDVTTQEGISYKDILIENTDWHSKSKLLKAIGHSDCSFFGTDNDIQALCSFVIKKNPPRKQGSKVIGLLDDTWVIKDLNITKDGIQETPSIIAYSKGEDSFLNKISYKTLDGAQYKSMIDEFYKTIFRINDPFIIMTWIGWLFATPVKPLITKLAGGFPLLQVYGGMGSGKTSTASQMMRLSGYKEKQTMSCTQRSFPMLKLLSSTNAIPVYLDEYKEKDMKNEEIDSLQRFMRKSYSGEVESKGRPDQTISDYILAAPVAVMGEWSINQPAIKERLLVARFTGEVKTNKNLNQEFEKLKSLELEGFMPEYIKYVLGVDIQNLFAESLSLVKSHFKDVEVAPRVLNNLSVMVMGLELFKRFGAMKGCVVPEMNIPELLNKQLGEITGTKSGQVRSAVDQLIEELSVMAQRSNIYRNTHYKDSMIQDKDGNDVNVIALRFNLIFPAFNEYAQRTSYEGDQLDKKSYMNLFTDCPYIVEKDRPVRFGLNTYRCVCIDFEKAREVGLNLEGFVYTPEI
jgi:hypothetical protein